MKQAVVVTNIPTPYRLPLFNELARQLEASGVVLEVVFGATGYRRRKWTVDLSGARFRHTFLDSTIVEVGGNVERSLFSYAGLGKALRRMRPNVVVVAGFSPATIKVWLRSWIDPTPYLIWSGSLEPRPPSRWRQAQRAVLVRRASAFVAYGEKAKEYLITLGAPREDVYVAINTVDTTFFSDETDSWRGRTEEGVTRLLSIGYLTPRKRLGRLLDALTVLAERRSDFVLDVIGDGEDRQRLEGQVAQAGLSEHVVFHGYKQRQELPRYLARSRCFVFPSDYDIWGLVLVEAMAAGLPVIASMHAGATPDLVAEGETGFAVDFADTEAVVQKIEWMLDHEREARAMGQRARAWIQEHASLARSAAGITEAVLRVLEPERVTAGNTTTAGAQRMETS